MNYVTNFIEKLIDEEINLYIPDKHYYKNYDDERLKIIISTLSIYDNYIYNRKNIVFEVLYDEPNPNFKLRTYYISLFNFDKKIYLVDPLINFKELSKYILDNKLTYNDIYSIIYQLYTYGNTTKNKKVNNKVYIKIVEPYSINIYNSIYLSTKIKIKMKDEEINVINILNIIERKYSNNFIQKLKNEILKNNLHNFRDCNLDFTSYPINNFKNNYRLKIYGDRTYPISMAINKNPSIYKDICNYYGILFPKKWNNKYLENEIINLNLQLSRPEKFETNLYVTPYSNFNFEILSIKELLICAYPIRIYDWKNKDDIINKIKYLMNECEFNAIDKSGFLENFNIILNEEKNLNIEKKEIIKKNYVNFINDIDLYNLKYDYYLNCIIKYLDDNKNKLLKNINNKLIVLFRDINKNYDIFKLGNENEISRRLNILKQYAERKEEWMNPLYNKHCLKQILGNRYLQKYSYYAYCDLPFYRYITPNSKKIPYQGSKYNKITIKHIGQRKLLLSEIEFITLYGHLAENIVYAGASPGTHCIVLSQMFPNHKFYLYDPLPFNERLKNHPNIKTFRELFTGDVIKLYKNMNVLFISDIRTVDTQGVLNTYIENADEIITEGIDQDMDLQYDWCINLKPKMASLKFRLPWVTREKIEKLPDLDKKLYLDGNIHFQSWPGKGSTEARLFTDCTKKKIYSNIEYEEQMAYHNTIERISLFPHTSYPELYDHCYDCTAELYVLEEYIKKYNKFNIYELNNMIHESITGKKCPNGKQCSVLTMKDIDEGVKNMNIVKKQYAEGRPDYNLAF